jgi:hypothetical protein
MGDKGVGEVPEDHDGLFIVNGDQASIADMKLSIAPDGVLEANVRFELGLDMCPSWLQIALDRQSESDKAYSRVLAALETKDDKMLAAALRDDFSASLQSIMSGAVALDAFYANVKERIEIDAATLQSWRTKPTARYKQVTEVLRRAFKLSVAGAEQVRFQAHSIFRYRDKAVHPDSSVKLPAYYPALNKGVDSRYTDFRNRNSLASLWYSMNLIRGAARNPNAVSDELKKYCDGLLARLEPIIAEWEGRYHRPLNEIPDLLRKQIQIEGGLKEE